jgi:hypothetical protein
MNKDETKQLEAHWRKLGESVTDEYHDKFADILSTFRFEESEPLEVWKGIAQALADFAGYRISLQAVVMEPTNDGTNNFKIVSYREVAAVESYGDVEQYVESRDVSSLGQLSRTSYPPPFLQHHNKGEPTCS